MQPCVYILTNDNKTTLYVGVTSDIEQRVARAHNGLDHRGHLVDALAVSHDTGVELKLNGRAVAVAGLDHTDGVTHRRYRSVVAEAAVRVGTVVDRLVSMSAVGSCRNGLAKTEGV